MEEQLTIPFRCCWYNQFRDIQFVKEIFDTLINTINKVDVTFENTS